MRRTTRQPDHARAQLTPALPVLVALVAFLALPACAGPAAASVPANATTAAPFAAPASPMASSPTTASSPASPSRPDDEGDDTPRARLGHYSTRDGLWGLVLDRTGAFPTARIDGSTRVTDLAVRRPSRSVTVLSSADGSVTLEISEWGGVSAYVPGGSLRDATPLVRDARAQPLPAPEIPALDTAFLARLGSDVQATCRTPITFELATHDAGAARASYHMLERAKATLLSTCRDDAGKAALARKVRRVRVVANGTEGKTRVEGQTFVIETAASDLGFGPPLHELTRILEKDL